MLFSIRPYMLFIGLDSIIIMLTYGYLAKAKTAFIRFVSFFIIIIFVWGGGLIAFVYIGTHASGAYGSIDTVLERAVVTQQDLVSDNYGNNSFDIGKFEPTIPGILSKAPLAINAGLFYPYPLRFLQRFPFIEYTLRWANVKVFLSRSSSCRRAGSIWARTS